MLEERAVTVEGDDGGLAAALRRAGAPGMFYEYFTEFIAPAVGLRCPLFIQFVQQRVEDFGCIRVCFLKPGSTCILTLQNPHDLLSCLRDHAIYILHRRLAL